MSDTIICEYSDTYDHKCNNDLFYDILIIILIIVNRIIKATIGTILTICTIITIIVSFIWDVGIYFLMLLLSVPLFTFSFFVYVTSGRILIKNPETSDELICIYRIVPYVAIISKKFLTYTLDFLLRNVVRIFIIPIIDIIYPIFDLEKKFEHILSFNKKNAFELSYDNFGCIDEVGLTQNTWNNYIVYLSQIKNNSLTQDMFDKLIIQQIDKINFSISLAISRANNEPKNITYSVFYNKISKIIGDAAKIRYRQTKNFMFKGIFNDDGPYRCFKYYDII
jgi:hypothetical protein